MASITDVKRVKTRERLTAGVDEKVKAARAVSDGTVTATAL